MDNLESEMRSNCPSECPSCGGSKDNAHDHKILDQQVKGGLAGSKLALAAITSFLLPIGMAIAGSALAGPGPGSRYAGGIAGLTLGVAVAIVAARVFWKDSKRQDNNPSDKEF